MNADHFQFGQYRLDAASGTLFHGSERVALAPKLAELLTVLVRAAGEVLTREELQQRLWPDSIVEDGSLTSHVSSLRKVLGERSGAQVFIETRPKRGYSFVIPVARIAAATNDKIERHMLLVLPFENLGAGERYDYFSDGLTEEMIAELARLSPGHLGVIARTSAMTFKSTSKGIAQIGAELKVSHVLEGSVRRTAERVRITCQLIRVEDEAHLWAESYERRPHDLLDVQVEVARAVTREIQIQLTPREQRRLGRDKARTVDSQAYETYLRGRHFWNRRTEDGIRKSIECFEGALQHDPGFAAAYDGLSDAHTMLACRGITSARESFHIAKSAARQAVRLEPELGEAYASLAHVRLHDWDWVDLEKEFVQAMELDSGYAIAHYWYAEYLMAMGRTHEALERVKRAWTLDPLNSVINASVGMIRYLANDYSGALEALQKGLELDPSHHVLHLRSGFVYLQRGMPNQAIGAMQLAVTYSGAGTEALAGLAQAHAATGDLPAMQTLVKQLAERTDRYVSPYNMAKIYAAAADGRSALEWLERAFDEHNPDLIELTREPCFAGLHSAAKFRSLAVRIGWRP
jgi:TolB-like protein/tetratricopeptide (TPR) repeat protein